MIKLLSFIFFLLLGSISPLIAGGFDGKYTLRMPSVDSSPECSGFILSDVFFVKNNEITGSIYHSEVGDVELQASVNSNGDVVDGEFTNATVEGTFEGSLKTLNGVWSASGFGCDGTWSLTSNSTAIRQSPSPMSPTLKTHKVTPSVTVEKSPFEEARKKCTLIGFKEGTEKYGECVLKLMN
jgi:hypothetical protein